MARQAARASASNSRRTVVVFSTLLVVLALTSILLLAMAPAPLTPDASSTLFALDAPNSLDVIFDTQTPAQPGRWKSIYIHHSATLAGTVGTLSQSDGGFGEHFLIGNGDGCVDGELQIGQRWNHQLAASAPAGASDLSSDSISICLVGNFDSAAPTPTQLRRLEQLVQTLQGRYHIPASEVWFFQQSVSPAGIGRYFPLTAFHDSLLK